MAYRDPYRDPYAEKYVRAQADKNYGELLAPQDPPTTVQSDQVYEQVGADQEYDPYGTYRDEPEPSHYDYHLNDEISNETEQYPQVLPEERSLDHDFAATTQPKKDRLVSQVYGIRNPPPYTFSRRTKIGTGAKTVSL
jgi:hypothetical protein